jgi:hypothetical protein
MMDVHECIFVVTCHIKGMKFSNVWKTFSRRFHKPSPTDKAIRALVVKFKRPGSVHDKSRCGCLRTACESTESFHQVFEGYKKLSVRNASSRLNIFITTVHRTMCWTLKKEPYHIQMLQVLHEDYPRFIELVDQIQNGSLMDHLLFSDATSVAKSINITVGSGLIKTN